MASPLQLAGNPPETGRLGRHHALSRLAGAELFERGHAIRADSGAAVPFAADGQRLADRGVRGLPVPPLSPLRAAPARTRTGGRRPAGPGRPVSLAA